MKSNSACMGFRLGKAEWYMDVKNEEIRDEQVKVKDEERKRKWKRMTNVFPSDGLETVLGCDIYKPSQDTTHYNQNPVHGLWHCGELGFVCVCVAIFPPQLENTATFGHSCQNLAGVIHFTTGELTGRISREV